MSGDGPRKKILASGVTPPDRDPIDLVIGGDRVWVSVSRKVRLARYESLDVGIGSSVSIEPGESITDAIKRVSAVVREEHHLFLKAVEEDQG